MSHVPLPPPPPFLLIYIIYPEPFTCSSSSPLLLIVKNSNWILNQANIANGAQPQKGVYQQQMRRPQRVGTLGTGATRGEVSGWEGGGGW